MNRRLGGAFPPSCEEGRLDEWAFIREIGRGEGEDTMRERRKRAGWRGDQSRCVSCFVYAMAAAFERMPRSRWSGKGDVARWSVLPRHMRSGLASILLDWRKSSPSSLHNQVFASWLVKVGSVKSCGNQNYSLHRPVVY